MPIPDRSGSVDEWEGDDEASPKRSSTLVRIRRHCEVSGDLDARYKKWYNTFFASFSLGEDKPRCVVKVGIYFECTFTVGIFDVRWVPRHQCRTAFPGELQ